MKTNEILKYLLVGALLFAGAACKNDPEEPRSEPSTGDEIEAEAEEAAEDTEEAVDEATEDLDDE
jgi:hypothetical protein